MSLRGKNLSPNSNRHLQLTMQEILLWSLIVLSPLQDSALQATPLKLIAASPAVLPLLALLFLAVARRTVRMDWSIRRFTLIATTYIVLVSLANLISFGRGVFLLEWRPLRTLSILTGLALFTILGLDYKNTRGLRLAVFLAFGITILGVFADSFLGANAIPFLQYTPNLSGRPHGFSVEASDLSVQIVAIGVLAMHFLQKRWQKLSVGAITFSILVYSQSKGGLISLLLCIFILGLAKSKSSMLTKLVTACVTLPALYIGMLFTLSMFTTVIETNQTSTIATRLSMAVYALITVAHNPLGVGFTGFLPSIPRYLPPAMYTVQSWFPFPLFFGEVKEYLYPPQQFADCKAFFFDFLVFFGIPFAVVFFKFGFQLLRQLSKYGLNSLFIGVLFSISALMTYYSILNAFTIPLLFGVSLYEVRKREDSLRLH